MIRLRFSDVAVTWRVFTDGNVLPGEATLAELNDDVADGNKIVTPAQLIALVGVDGDIATGTDQVFSVDEGHVLTRARIDN